MREVGGDLVDVQGRVDPHDVHPVLAREVAHRGDPPVTERQRRRQPDVDTLRVEVEPGQWHVVLPADQPAQPAQRGGDRAQGRPVAPGPHGALGPGGHELAVPVDELTGGGEVEQRVVDGRAGGFALLDPHDEPHRVLAGDRAEAVGRRPGHDDGVLDEEGVPVGVAVPDRPAVDPERRPRHEGLREHHEPRTLTGGLRRQLGDPVDRRLAVHQHVGRLHGRHHERSPWSNSPRRAGVYARVAPRPRTRVRLGSSTGGASDSTRPQAHGSP